MLDLRENKRQSKFRISEFIKFKRPWKKYLLILIGLCILFFPYESAVFIGTWINMFIGTLIEVINI